jgi:enoyl-CoA hydratase/carnithine racemase
MIAAGRFIVAVGGGGGGGGGYHYRQALVSARHICLSATNHQSFHHSSFANADTPPPQTYESKTPSDIKINIKDHVKIISLGQGIVNVLLSRPNKLNSLDIPMFEAIAEAASRLRNDRELNKDLRVVIISGEGRAFCSGLDAKGVALSGPKSSLNRLLKRPSDYGGEEGLGNLAQDVCYLWRKLPVPVIAVLHGYCFGGGLQIALGADMRFARPDTKVSIMESRWGLIPDMGCSIVLRELVRMDVAKELTMTGRIICGEEAMKIGLITRCVNDPMEEALKVAKEIIQRSPDSVAASKELLQSTWMVADDATCLKTETRLQLKLIGTWNQIAAAGRQFGVNLPYFHRHFHR